ncbi:MAG: lipopolysaccharide heptosyltransferase II [Acidobacteriota bacterium]
MANDDVGRRRVVVVAPNWLGDAVMALPALADLRRAWAGAHVTVAARAPLAPLFQLVPGVDDTMALAARRGAARWSGWWTDSDRLRQGRFDIAVLLPNSFESALSAWRAGVPRRIGFATDLRGPLLTDALETPASSPHQAAYYQALPAGLGLATGPMAATLEVGEGARARAHALLADAGVPAGAALLVLAPGAAYGRAKQWPPERFVDLAARAAAERQLVPVLVGTRADAAVCHEIARRLAGAGAVNLAGRTDLPTLAGLLASAAVCVSNDSGAMHLAAAAGTRVVAVFGPTDERRTYPIGPAGWRPAIVTGEAWCRPCLLRECPIDHRCMRSVTSAMVLERL